MEEYRNRVRIFAAITTLVLAILGGRLAYLQILNEDKYDEVAQGNAIRQVRVLPARGAFYDRNGVIMVGNVSTYSITLQPNEFDTTKIGLLAELLQVTDSTVAAELAEAAGWSIYRPTRAFAEVPFEVFSRVQEHAYELPGVGFDIGQKRDYLTRAEASHVFGYIREITDSELDRMRTNGYRMGDIIGQTGLEKFYEPYLRGRMGSEMKLVDSKGLAFAAYQQGQNDEAPFGGYNLHLTLDAELQALAESLFVNKRGGVVALDAESGGILAIASAPDFDPTLFSKPLDPETWKYLTTSPTKPMLNRATMSRMPPGSTWKPFMALMALQEGLIKPGETVTCRGGHPLGGGAFFTCMHVHGPLGVVEAIQHSCNTFFFEMMYRANVDMFSRYAHMFGFGEQAPTDLMEQDAGLIPDSSYFNRVAGVGKWGKGWTLSLGIGQGNMAVTPLQMTRYVMAVANGGKPYAPHLINYLYHPGTGDVIRPSLPAPKQIPIKEEYFDLVREGMKRVMEAGTGYYVQIPGIPSGGKTGTAQNPHGKDHSIFILFAPFDNPKIAIAAMVENAGYGASAAGPIASLLAEKYLTGKIANTPERQWVLQRALNARSAPLPDQEEIAANE